MDTVAILKNDIFSLLGHFLRVILGLILFSYIKFHEIRLINLIYHTRLKSYLGLSMAIWNKHFWHSNDGHFGFGK